MRKLEDYIKRANQLMEQARTALSHARGNESWPTPLVPADEFAALRSAGLSFIEQVYGREHSYYEEFQKNVADTNDYYTKHAVGILTSIQAELAGGWIQTTKGLVSAELFADFLEMSEHLLSEGFKDAAAVLIGGVLEEHLRQLAEAKSIPFEDSRNGKLVRRKADSLNADLAKAKVYSVLDQKSVTAWLDLRNKAAHGQYQAYTDQQVETMMTGVRDFIVRNPPK